MCAHWLSSEGDKKIVICSKYIFACTKFISEVNKLLQEDVSVLMHNRNRIQTVHGSLTGISSSARPPRGLNADVFIVDKSVSHDFLVEFIYPSGTELYFLEEID
jgi:hypothetical protein